MLEHAAEAGRIFEVQTCIDEWATMLRTKTTVQIMRKLKAAGYRLYYLTNIPTDIMDELRQRWFYYSTADVASSGLHLCKPNRKFTRGDADLSPGTMSRFCGRQPGGKCWARYNRASPVALYRTKSFTRALGACGIRIE